LRPAALFRGLIDEDFSRNYVRHIFRRPPQADDFFARVTYAKIFFAVDYGLEIFSGEVTSKIFPAMLPRR
jgi:hypothetical protein